MSTLKKVLGLLSDASNATVAAAVVATIVELLPGVDIPAPAATGVVVAVGTIAKVLENVLGVKPAVVPASAVAAPSPKSGK